jgi:hypothetical protein
MTIARFHKASLAGVLSGIVSQNPKKIKIVERRARANAAFGLGNQKPVRTNAT